MNDDTAGSKDNKRIHDIPPVTTTTENTSTPYESLCFRQHDSLIDEYDGHFFQNFNEDIIMEHDNEINDELEEALHGFFDEKSGQLYDIFKMNDDDNDGNRNNTPILPSLEAEATLPGNGVLPGDVRGVSGGGFPVTIDLEEEELSPPMCYDDDDGDDNDTMRHHSMFEGYGVGLAHLLIKSSMIISGTSRGYQNLLSTNSNTDNVVSSDDMSTSKNAGISLSAVHSIDNNKEDPQSSSRGVVMSSSDNSDHGKITDMTLSREDSKIIRESADALGNVISTNPKERLMSFSAMMKASHTAPRFSSLDFKDEPSDMTYGRRIALFLMKYKFYNPKQYDIDDDSSSSSSSSQSQSIRPSLLKAWAYFEHTTLPRHIVEETDKSSDRSLLSSVNKNFQRLWSGEQLDRAEPGECELPTKLYSPIWTPLSQMGDFGLGVGLYFSSLRYMCLLTFMAGLINIYSMYYYQSLDYSKPDPNLNYFLQMSALCSNTEWVHCLDCDKYITENQTFFSSSRVHQDCNITVQNGAFNETITSGVTIAEKNLCHGDNLGIAMVNMGTLFFIMLGILYLNHYQSRVTVQFDEDEQTAQDYSIVITNPPKDASDPDEWRDFLCNIDSDIHVTALTIARDNDILVRTLVKRRDYEFYIQHELESYADINDLAKIAANVERNRGRLRKVISALFHPFGYFWDIATWHNRLVVLNSKIRGLVQIDYPVTKIFVTFETEAAQRKVLSRLSVGRWSVIRNDTTRLPPNCLFRGKLVLDVSQSEEPDTVRWTDLNTKFKDRVKIVITSTVATLGAIYMGAFMVREVSKIAPTLAVYFIALANSVFPKFGKALNNLESHPSETSKQASLYSKIAFFRWVNTAIVLTIVTPFTSTLSPDDDTHHGLLTAVYTLFYAELITSSGSQFLDISGNIKRHFHAPRALHQQKMNIHFQGSPYDLAERYTSMTKIIFLAFYYSALFPAGFFMCSATLFVNYLLDRFSVMKTWTPAPQLGDTINYISRKYFFSLTVVFYAMVNSYTWSSFPFDNLCEKHHKSSFFPDVKTTPHAVEANGFKVDAICPKILVIELYNKTWTWTWNDHYEINNWNKQYEFCNQNLFPYFVSGNYDNTYPPRATNDHDPRWMSEEQKQLTTINAWTSLAVVVFFLGFFIYDLLCRIPEFFKGKYVPVGDDMGINFSTVQAISTYVPEVKSDQFAYPLIACTVDELPDSLFMWNDPDHPRDYYNLTHDIRDIIPDFVDKNALSRVKYYPPPEMN